ncbi:MAG: helix-turn-helix domain-containing protein [Chitinispirillales bacterium]|jgi:transcriptional regulator with XRE-family HTH domain|nr:helix-turn-helix domain-containing protein [Chitinispirillales bacterium]
MFYKRLQQFCVEKGVSMQKVAADIGISPAAISKWNKGGKPNNANARALADYFGTSAAELLEGGGAAPAISAGLGDDLNTGFRAVVWSQQDTIRDLSNSNKTLAESSKILAESSKTLAESSKTLAESGKNWSESSKNFSEASKNWSESSKNFSEASKNWSTSNRNLSESNKSLAESIKSLAVGGGSPKGRR